MPEQLPPQIICAGMVVADVFGAGLEAMPAMGETGMLSGVVMATGGDANNQANALAKLGNSVGIMGMIGDDAQGKFITTEYEARGIDMRGLCVDKDNATVTTIVLVDKGGEHWFFGKRQDGPGSLGPEHFDLSVIKPGVKFLSVASLFWSSRFDREAVVPLLQKAKSVGAVTIADMVMDQKAYGLDELAGVWPLLDYVAPSELEAKLLTGTKNPQDVAAAFRQRGVKNVILKRGADGVMAFIGDDVFTCPAFQVPLIDTTGAGDNFIAGFLHGLARDFDPGEALRFGTATAALSIGAVGAGAGLKDLTQVEAFLGNGSKAR